MTHTQDGGTGHVPGSRMCICVQSNRWPRRGPLPAPLREVLAQGFGARLRELRRERGWTQRQLAEAMGRSVDTISRFETGKHRPTADVIMRLARHLATPRRDRRSIALELAGLVGRNIRSGGREANGYLTAEEIEANLRRRIEGIRSTLDAGTGQKRAHERRLQRPDDATTLRPHAP